MKYQLCILILGILCFSLSIANPMTRSKSAKLLEEAKGLQSKFFAKSGTPMSLEETQALLKEMFKIYQQIPEVDSMYRAGLFMRSDMLEALIKLGDMDASVCDENSDERWELEWYDHALKFVKRKKNPSINLVPFIEHYKPLLEEKCAELQQKQQPDANEV